MSHRTAALALAFALATTGVAQAQSTPSTPAPGAPAADTSTMTMPMPKMLSDMGAGSMIPLREVAAIGTGVIVGAALWHVVIGHGFVLAGAAIGGWIGDWCYGGMHAAPPVHTGS
jgi:hypothetical protein